MIYGIDSDYWELASLYMTRVLPVVVAALFPTMTQAQPDVCATHAVSDARATALSRAPLKDVELCVNANDPLAQNELGRRYGLGIGGVQRDSHKSFELYQVAAKAGDPYAQVNVAVMYLKGEGTRQDYTKAYSSALPAANNGNAEAQRMLGYMHAMGLGLAKDGLLAEKWFLAAANQGHVQAQSSLAQLYSDGQLLPPDPGKAVMWLHRARDARLSGRVWRDGSDTPVEITEVRPEYAPKLAEQAVKVVLNLEGKELDYSPASLNLIDAMLNRLRSEGNTPERLRNTVIFFGCYVGEVFVRNLRLAWVVPSDQTRPTFATLKASDGTHLDPIEKVRTRLRSGQGSSIADLYAETVKESASR